MLPAEDIMVLCQATDDPSYYFVRKALGSKFGPQLAEHVCDLLVLKKEDNSRCESDQIQSYFPFTELLALPSVSDLKQVVRDGGGLTLKEIKSATIEKLTNKIIRSFWSDILWYFPILLLVLL